MSRNVTVLSHLVLCETLDNQIPGKGRRHVVNTSDLVAVQRDAVEVSVGLLDDAHLHMLISCKSVAALTTLP